MKEVEAEPLLSGINPAEIINSANFFHVACVSDFRILHANQWISSHLKVNAEELLEKNIFEALQIDSRIRQEIMTKLQQEKQLQNISFEIKYGGRKIYGIWNIKKIAYSNDSGYNIHFFGSDVTERRKLEVQLAQSEKLSALGRMASGIAHDISKPINAVVSLLQVLQDYSDDEFICDRLALITRQMDHLNNKVRQLVDLGRPMRPAVEPVNVNNVLEEALRIIRYDVSLKNVNIQTYYCPGMRRINLSFDHLLQVFINILLNAGEAVSSLEDANVMISTECRPDKIRIEIQDNGRGISEDDLPHVFDPFYTASEIGDGTGLGLWMCHNIISSIGGRIWIDSTKNVGTSVHLELPLLMEEENDQ